MSSRKAVSRVVSAVIISVIVTGIVVGFGAYYGAISAIKPITKTVTSTITKTVAITKTTTSTASPTLTTTTTPTTTAVFSLKKRVITTSIKDSIITYTEWRYYSKPSLTTQTIKALREKVTNEIMGTYSGINITNLSISVYPNNTIKIVFAVSGKVWLSGNGKYADFLWLLTPLGLDFIESHFNETNHGLYWVGTLNNVSTEINVLLPKQATVYKAWGGAVGHCHGHVWWPTKP